MSSGIVISEATQGMASTLDGLVLNGVACRDMENNFLRTFSVGKCIQGLKKALTPEVMKLVMFLQGSPLGFRTDKDRDGGYNIDVVREAVIASSMMGLVPCGNQFNIIGGRMYITKEGFTYLLSTMKGLRYSLSPDVPAQNRDNSVVRMVISWDYKGESGEHVLNIPVRVNKGMGDDAVLGKADRKAKCWLFNRLTSMGTTDADEAEVYAAAEPPPMRDATPPRRGRGEAAGGGLRSAFGGAAPSSALPAASAASAAPAAPVPQLSERLASDYWPEDDIPMGDEPVAPAPAPAVAQDAPSNTNKVLKVFVAELTQANKRGNAKATPAGLRDWIRQYMDMPHIDLPITGMDWQLVLDNIMNNQAVEFDSIFGTRFAEMKGGVA